MWTNHIVPEGLVAEDVVDLLYANVTNVGRTQAKVLKDACMRLEGVVAEQMLRGPCLLLAGTLPTCCMQAQQTSISLMHESMFGAGWCRLQCTSRFSDNGLCLPSQHNSEYASQCSSHCSSMLLV